MFFQARGLPRGCDEAFQQDGKHCILARGCDKSDPYRGQWLPRLCRMMIFITNITIITITFITGRS